jgi:hypothetical protein
MHLVHQLLAVIVAFLQNVVDLSVESLMVLGGQVFGRDDDDRHLREVVGVTTAG